MTKIQSITIVKNDYGYTATLRFEDRFCDKIISSNNKVVLHKLIDRHVEKVCNGAN